MKRHYPQNFYHSDASYPQRRPYHPGMDTSTSSSADTSMPPPMYHNPNPNPNPNPHPHGMETHPMGYASYPEHNFQDTGFGPRPGPAYPRGRGNRVYAKPYHRSPPVNSPAPMHTESRGPYIRVPEYTMIIRRTEFGWQFLGSIEDSHYWFLPKTNKESYITACRHVTPMVVSFMHDRAHRSAAVYIVTEESAKSPWKCENVSSRKSSVPLREWIYFSEVFHILDKHALSTSASSSAQTPIVWNRCVDRDMVYIVQELVMKYLGMDDTVKEKPLVLYHGTNIESVRSIMSQGFKVLPCKCEGGEDTTELKSGKIEQFKDSTNCTCRMMGKGVYGCSFYRAVKFAQKKFGRSACILRFVVPKSVVFYTVKKEDICECSCEQSYVDHCGKLIQKYGAVYLGNNSLPATSSPEWVIGDPRKCSPINFIAFPAKHADDDVVEESLSVASSGSRSERRRVEEDVVEDSEYLPSSKDYIYSGEDGEVDEGVFEDSS